MKRKIKSGDWILLLIFILFSCTTKLETVIEYDDLKIVDPIYEEIKIVAPHDAEMFLKIFIIHFQNGFNNTKVCIYRNSVIDDCMIISTSELHNLATTTHYSKDSIESLSIKFSDNPLVELPVNKNYNHILINYDSTKKIVYIKYTNKVPGLIPTSSEYNITAADTTPAEYSIIDSSWHPIILNKIDTTINHEYNATPNSLAGINLKMYRSKTFSLDMTLFADEHVEGSEDEDLLFNGVWEETKSELTLTFTGKKPKIDALFDKRYSRGEFKIMNDSMVTINKFTDYLAIYGVVCEKVK